MYLDDSAKEYFLLYSHLDRHLNKLVASQKIIKQFLNICDNPYLSWSTGKDSTCVLSLVRLVDKEYNIPIIHFDLGVELPNTDAYKKNFENITTFKPKEDILKVMENNGWESKESRKINFINQFTSENNYTGHFMGLRYNESSARKNLYKYGAIYKRSDGLWVCNPIYNWTFEDVFAYLISSDIPVHPHYSIKSNQPLENRRVGGYVSGRNRGAELGRFYWFKEQYPEEFKKLADKFPIVKQYV